MILPSSLFMSSLGLGLGVCGSVLLLYPALRIERQKYRLHSLAKKTTQTEAVKDLMRTVEERLKGARDDWNRGDSHAYQAGGILVGLAFLLQLIALWID